MARVHSRVGIITNSSSVVYTWYSDNAEENIMACAQTLLVAMGDDRKAEDVFEIRKGLSSEFIESICDDPESFFDDDSEDGDLYDRFYEEHEAAEKVVCEKFGATSRYERFDGDEAKKSEFDAALRAMDIEVIGKYMRLDELELNNENRDYPEPNFNLELVNKETGGVIDISTMFFKVFDQDASYG